MQRTLCDWCPETTDATQRVSFVRLVPPDEQHGGMLGMADHPFDLCRKHYDELWAFIQTKGAPRYGPR
jgi:hypothetical protein